MVGSRPVTSGLGSTRLNLIQDLRSCNTTDRSEVDMRSEYGRSRRNTAVGVGATNSVQPETVPPSLRIDANLQPQLQEWEGQNLFNQIPSNPA